MSEKDYLGGEDEFLAGEEFAPAEARGFAPEQLVGCARCTRRNPPTRMNCLYCGEPLPVTDESAHLRRPVLRPLEGWERGLNVILLPRRSRELTREDVAEAAGFLKIDAARLREMCASRRALPVARAATEEEVGLIERRLGALGLSVEILSDELLAAESAPPARVRRLELAGETLKGWAAAGEEAREVAWSEVVLVATGRIFTRRVEVEERGALARRTEEVIETRETMADEAALEIYARGESGGWRVMSDGFDYSCLGETKGLLARENFVRLAAALRARAAGASYDEEYNRIRHLLAHAWPLAEQTGSGGLRRSRPGKFNKESFTVVSNDAQFTRYARLRYQLELRRRAGESESL